MRKLFIVILCILFSSGCYNQPTVNDSDMKNSNSPATSKQNLISEASDNAVESTAEAKENAKDKKQPVQNDITKFQDANSGKTQIEPAHDNITSNTSNAKNGKIIVVDPGHGKSSSLMSDSEKQVYGYTFDSTKGWGEWRHFKSGTIWQNCEGSGCSGRAPANGGCWYPIGHGDRNTEPDLNYTNALNAKKYLEQLGYTVRITRSQDENPSLTQRIKYCYPNSDTTAQPDASAYVCLHSNAGGGRGSCYISLSGLYDQAGIPGNYVEAGNALGVLINNSIVQNTSLSAYGNGRYDGYPELVLFCKSPVPVAYMEIGFYDNANDLNILKTESEIIGKAIADGVHSYFSGVQ